MLEGEGNGCCGASRSRSVLRATVFGSLVRKLADCTITPVCDAIGGLINFQRNADSLDEQVRRLDLRTVEFKSDLAAAERNAENLAPSVKEWLRRRDEIIKETDDFLEAALRRNVTCGDWFPDVLSRYSCSVKAKEMSDKIEKLLKDGQFKRVSHPTSLVQIGLAYTEAERVLYEGGTSSKITNPDLPQAMLRQEESLEYKMPYTKELLKALHDDQINIIGICGIVSGEEVVTAKEFRNRTNHLFERVVILMMTHDVKQIQSSIAHELGVNLEDENELERANKLCEFMANDTGYLIILLDVWTMVDLERIGIPLAKVILMSKRSNTFDEMRGRRNFKLLYLAATSSKEYIHFESRNSALGDIMESLKDQANPIVACGMAGVGKTTLVKDVGKRARASGLFDKVVIAEVGKEPDIRKIQEIRADFLNVKLDKESQSGIAAKLHARLSKQERLLVILDDVWTGLDTSAIGIPDSCKLLVSSRNHDVFNEIRTRKVISIDVLLENESWLLFKDQACRSFEVDELHDVAYEVMKECDGLPLAICTVGRAMQHKSKAIWVNALRQLRKSKPDHISGVIPKVYRNIELSYECLESTEAKLCFLLCCLFPEGNILIEDLIKWGLGLGQFEHVDSIGEGRNCILALVEILKSCSLLSGCGKTSHVKMNHVVQDVGLYIASQGKDGIRINHRLEFSDMNNGDEEEYTAHSLSAGSKTLLVVVSRGEDVQLQQLDIGAYGNELKVLDCLRIALDMKDTLAKQLENIRTLRLDNCKLEGDISVIGKLRTLLILSLRSTDIKQIPSEFGNLSKLKLLDLTDCRSLESISPHVMSRLAQLEELYMMDSLRWQTSEERNKIIDIVIKSGLLSLKKLMTLEIVLPPIPDLFQSPPLFDGLQRFKVSVQGKYPDSLKLDQIDNSLRVCSFGNSIVRGLIKGIGTLFLDEVDVGDVLNRQEEFINLMSLTINSCPMEYVIDTMSSTSKVFPLLQVLKLQNSCLTEICHGQLPMGSFGELRRVELKQCLNIKYLFPSSMARNLISLEELTVEGCMHLEQIIVLEDSEHRSEEIKFPNLIELNLRNLPYLVAICSNININVPQLITVNVENLPELAGLCLNNLVTEGTSAASIQHLFNPEVRCCGQLRFVMVKNCKKLCGVFSSSTVLNLQNLEKLVVKNCSSLRRLFECEGLHFPERHVVLSSLESIELHDLPNLDSIWEPAQKVGAFENLISLDVVRCGRLRNIFSIFEAECLKKLESISISQCLRMNEVFANNGCGEDDTQTPNKIDFPRLQYIQLDLPQLKSFCPVSVSVCCPESTKLFLNCPRMAPISRFQVAAEVNLQ